VPLGVSVLRESTAPGRPTARVTVRVPGFSPASRFAPRTALWVCFTPQTPFGFTLQGFPLPTSRPDLPPGLCRRAVIPWMRSHRLTQQVPRRTYTPEVRFEGRAFGRLHGLAPVESPFRPAIGLGQPASRAPPGFFPLQGLPLPKQGGSFWPPHPPSRLAMIALARNHSVHIGVLPAPGVGIVARATAALPEVPGHRLLGIRPPQVLAYFFASGRRLRRRPFSTFCEPA